MAEVLDVAITLLEGRTLDYGDWSYDSLVRLNQAMIHLMRILSDDDSTLHWGR